MKTINHECYVSLEVAKLLKEAGFDWEVNHSYPNVSALDNSCSGYMEDLPFYHNLNDGKYSGLSVPTLEVAQRWLREVKKISVEAKTCCWVNRYQDGKYTISYIYEICTIDTSILPNKEDKFIRYTIDCAHNIEFQTYEEALDAGINKTLEIILNM